VIGAWVALRMAWLWQGVQAVALALADLAATRAARWRARWRG
jgi:hypothetical protein